MEVYGYDGEPRDLDWFHREFGPIVISDLDGEGWYAHSVHAKRGNVACIVRAIVRGEPTAGMAVAWYWPDADVDPECGPSNGVPEGVIPDRAQMGRTAGPLGEVGFAMGPGAYYDPANNKGPHATWMYGSGTPSQVIFGIGMLMGTNHYHFDVWFEYKEEDEPGPEPEPEPEPGSYRLRVPAMELEVGPIQIPAMDLTIEPVEKT